MSDREQDKERIMLAVSPLAKRFGLDLIDVETEYLQQKTVLRLIVDRRGGVDIDSCAELSELADPVIEQELGIDYVDVFEVSSPGLDRPLETLADCRRHAGEKVQISFREAAGTERSLSGMLVVADESIGVECDGEAVFVPFADVVKVKREIVFA